MDVLGFSNLVYNKDQSKIEQYFSYLLSDFSTHLSTRKFKFLLISDSIVVSTRNTKENLSELVFIIGKIQYELLLKGILVRGAISSGNLYINKLNSVIVGPGLINAYKLEKVAKYPRIILDRKLISTFFESTSAFLDYMNRIFEEQYGEQEGNVKFDNRLGDGMPYLNYVRKVVRYGPTYHRNNPEQVIKLFASNFYSNEHFEKYNWLLKELLEELSLGIIHYSNHPEISHSKNRLKSIMQLQDQLIKL